MKADCEIISTVILYLRGTVTGLYIFGDYLIMISDLTMKYKVNVTCIPVVGHYIIGDYSMD